MKMGNSDNNRPLVFISYAREDNVPRGTRKGWLDWFCTHIVQPFKAAGIDIFIDNNIKSGEYSPAINAALERATAAILLISPDFMNSQYIIERELPVLLTQYKLGNIELFPVLLSHCCWEILPIPYTDPGNKSATFLLSKLLLPGHDPKNPLDSLAPGEVNKVFIEVTKRILDYHTERLRKIEEQQSAPDEDADNKNSVKEPVENEVIKTDKSPDHKIPPMESKPAKSTTIVPDSTKIENSTIDEQKPPWASATGKDKYGTWAEFTIKGITQRMRWIEPGEFLMGSPEDEPGRLDNEFQHRVKITKGYWLADTTCSQALWKAVMGSNPSYFKGYSLPVDSISLDIAYEFLIKCNSLLPGINLRLPSEAEWEYACRAGTTTPFSFGNTISTEEVNYHGNYPYGKGKRGVYREKTMEVISLPCNAFGLYHMHGNVLEWCKDWYADDYYNNSPLNDPPGSKTGANRVLRGGCWNNSAKNVRSACRSSGGPAICGKGYGFRPGRDQN